MNLNLGRTGSATTTISTMRAQVNNPLFFRRTQPTDYSEQDRILPSPVGRSDSAPSEKKLMNRWLVVVGGILIQLSLGAIYAWSVFTPSLSAAGWTKAQTQFVFSAGLASFAVVMVVAGYYLMPRLGPRLLTIVGGFTLGLGYVLGGLIGGTSVT
ncbi:MAG: hypothetical protein HKN13_00285, partial [Rhodothermales bacterium]|nr:hypothetical protein [Rhodothermales bacterium]